MLKGSIVALSTPFTDDGVNEKTLIELFELHNRSGTSAVLIFGTTGESPNIRENERKRMMELAKEHLKIPVIAGAGTNSTEKTIKLAKEAESFGMDYLLVITPYYNKPTQEGLYRHFKAVAEEVSTPIIIYNVPGRTGVNILPETVARLSEFNNIVGIKEASGNLLQMTEIISMTPSDFVLLSGDDMLTLPIISIGGKGVISVTANIAPKEVAELCKLALSGRYEEARKLHERLYYLSKAMFIETNPIPVKTALLMLGYDMGPLRPPLCPMREENREKLKKALRNFGFNV
ncbi:4-hydroxy-tetrahydrodipicolinate synthase [bacterium]|nr:MAG: 4-hydroxy-tetrahydrodipicolinate synthase [bacterium]